VRYDVYCGEFDRHSPYADHEQKTLIDNLDTNGASFLAMVDGRAIGTSRINLARHGELAGMPELYGMAASPHHPEKTCVITKYAIREPWRGGATYMRIFGAMATYLYQSRLSEIYIDCVPKLARFYATMGFRQCEAEFVHYENGLSVPMVLDIPAYLERMPLDERRRKNRWR
jgi:predicted GNAT family N-acyltransferase